LIGWPPTRSGAWATSWGSARPRRPRSSTSFAIAAALALAGNHDRWVTGQLSLSMLPLPRQRAQLQWQHRVLSNEQLAWLAALPAQGRAHDIELWHGSVQDPITGWISSPQDAADHLARQQARIGLVGHTHRPLIAENNGTTIDYDEHPATTSPTTTAQCSTPVPCSARLDGSSLTSVRDTRPGTRPDGSGSLAASVPAGHEGLVAV
jgi:diadenosine tetraphosphatase ApaH/serine/threonine PP2A family protein phosphatase